MTLLRPAALFMSDLLCIVLLQCPFPPTRHFSGLCMFNVKWHLWLTLMPNFITSHGFFFMLSSLTAELLEKNSDLRFCIKYQTIDLPPNLRFVAVVLSMVFSDFLTWLLSPCFVGLFWFWMRFLLWLKRHTLLLQQKICLPRVFPTICDRFSCREKDRSCLGLFWFVYFVFSVFF